MRAKKFNQADGLWLTRRLKVYIMIVCLYSQYVSENMMISAYVRSMCLRICLLLLSCAYIRSMCMNLLCYDIFLHTYNNNNTITQYLIITTIINIISINNNNKYINHNNNNKYNNNTINHTNKYYI